MSDSATFTYHGPEQEVRIGGQTFHRFMATTVTDGHVIAEARTLGDFTEAGQSAPVVKPDRDARAAKFPRHAPGQHNPLHVETLPPEALPPTDIAPAAEHRDTAPLSVPGPKAPDAKPAQKPPAK